MKVLFTIGGINIHFFGLMIGIGILSALWLLNNEAKRRKMSTEKIIDMAKISILGGVFGARVGYVLFYNLQFYLNNPLDILKVYDGGLSIHGGIIGGTLFVLIYLKKNAELNVFEVSDMIAPALILAQGIGRVGCDVFGKAMTVPKFWGIPIQGIVYHPVQMYEFVLDYLFFLYLWKKRKKLQYHGQLFGIYIIGFAIIRSIVELSRTNPQVFGLFSIAHLLSLVFLILGILWLIIARSKTQNMKVQPIQSDTRPSFLDTGIVIVLILISIFIFYYVQL